MHLRFYGRPVRSRIGLLSSVIRTPLRWGRKRRCEATPLVDVIDCRRADDWPQPFGPHPFGWNRIDA